MTEIEEKVVLLAEEYYLAGEALFDVNAKEAYDIKDEDGNHIFSDEVIQSLRNAFSTGYSLGAMTTLQKNFSGAKEEPIVQPVKSNIISGSFI